MIKSYIKSRPITFTILSLLVFATIILVITALNMKSTGEVEICVAPESATVTIDGKEYQNGTYRLPTGELKVHIEKDGFTSQDLSINNSGANVTKIYAYLVQSDGSMSWYNTHESDALLLNTIGDYLAEKKAEEYTEKHPIISSLPIIYANYDENYNYTEYRIDGGSFPECDQDFCLKITDTTGDNLEDAKSKIREAGFNPDEYEILYEYLPIIPLE